MSKLLQTKTSTYNEEEINAIEKVLDMGLLILSPSRNVRMKFEGTLYEVLPNNKEVSSDYKSIVAALKAFDKFEDELTF